MRLLFTTLLFLGSLLPLWSQSAFQCSTDELAIPASVLQRMQALSLVDEEEQARIMADQDLKVARIAVEIGSHTYEHFKQDTSDIYRTVLEQFKQISYVFERELKIRVVVTSIQIHKDAAKDPFRQSRNVYDLLYWLSVREHDLQQFDKRIYLHTNYADQLGGIANINGPYCVAPMDNVDNIMHELGHTFGALHTHNCAWPGGPIDKCTTIEGDCYQGALSAQTGTLMSYCGRRERAFHPLVRSLIRQQAETQLVSIVTIPIPVKVVQQITPKLGDFISWAPSVQAKFYRVSYSLQADFSDETTFETPYAGFTTHRFKHAPYYVRIKAINEWGESPWSESFLVRPHPGFEAPPLLISPANHQIVAPYRSASIQFSSVYGAVGYQVQITTITDHDWGVGMEEYVTSTSMHFEAQLMPYKWRVRAVYPSGSTGAWSEVGYFSGNTYLGHKVYLPFESDAINVPTTFPFAYSLNTWESSTRVEVVVASDPDFQHRVFAKTYTPTKEFSDVIQGLPPSTKLYFRLQETSSDYPFDKPVMVVDFTHSFTTGIEELPEELTFMSSIDQQSFGTVYTHHVAIGKESVWFDAGINGYYKINPVTLASQGYGLDNTNSLLGKGIHIHYHTVFDNNHQAIGFLNMNWNGNYKLIQLQNEQPSEAAQVKTFYHYKLYDNVQGAQSEAGIFWTQHVLYQLGSLDIEKLIQFQPEEYISVVQVRDNNVWLLLHNYSNDIHSVIQFNLQTRNVVKWMNTSQHTSLDKLIYQLHVDKSGYVWVRQQQDYQLATTSIAYYDGSQWHRVNREQIASEGYISQLSVAPSDEVYVSMSGQATQIYHYQSNDTTWEAVGPRIPLTDYKDNLWIDMHENAWLVGNYGLAHLLLRSCEPKAITSASKEVLVQGEAVVLKAENCSKGQLISWSNQEETKSNQFVPVGETLTLQLFSTTTFRVKCEGKNCIEEDSTFTIQVTPHVPIEIVDENDKQRDVEVKIYPNPASEYVLIEVKNNPKEPYVFHVVDMHGVTLRTISTRQVQLVDLNSLPPAQYIIWAMIEGEKKVWEIVKQ